MDTSDQLPHVPKSASKLNARGQPYRPGDLILDRYMSNASDWEREEARKNLQRFVAIILRIFTRLATEDIPELFSDSYNPLNGMAPG